MSAGLERRLFLALWPGRVDADRCQQWADTVVWTSGARRHGPADLHLTLHFLGATAEATRQALEQQLPRDIDPIGLQFDRWQDWDGTLVLRPSAVPAALVDLQAGLAETLASIGLPVDSRPFRPHVTVARKAGGSRPATAPNWSWRASRLVLAESRQGYHPLWISPT
ncbi:2'-5' RNA ligase family protein [Inhella gelatinilytica]|uniref:2'-5' RNA ligase family protein n=1 Tax=Inhella gelatinilytica TaxID=2795030 RepID=A0A931ITC8_9BURK|nr:2'-5' RNA ligase family protein [Inhella gelatinilytica]MBH9551622.1 2'-5' RNA ligase family protein [Inhella gelatinilytica]